MASAAGVRVARAPHGFDKRAGRGTATGRFCRGTDAFDILVNNAGGSLHTPFPYLQESDDDWQRVMDLNVMGAVWASKAVLPAMSQNGYGRIVNFGSKAGRYGSLIAGAVMAAKGAIAAMTQMAQGIGPMGINVNCICPGVVMTERTAGLWAERRSEQEREQVLATIPVRRYW